MRLARQKQFTDLQVYGFTDLAGAPVLTINN
jgi:hypothetical protein